MKHSLSVAALFAATFLCWPGPLSAGFPPTMTGVNIWNVPVDVYQSSNLQGGSLVIANCTGNPTPTIQSCMQNYLNNWGKTQGASTVRFSIAMTMPLDYPASGNVHWGYETSGPEPWDGEYSHPWLWNNGHPIVQSQWLQNLKAFFADVKAAGLAISPMLSFDPAGPYLYDSANPASDCAGHGPLMFYPWLPYGFEQSNRFDDGQDINTCYSGGSSNPEFFWGWAPFESLLSGIIQAAGPQGANVRIEEMDILQERNFYDFTVGARLIYDNVNHVDVLGFIRSTLASGGFDSSRATFSGSATNTIQGFDCGSIYGDSAMLVKTSEITGAIAGYTGSGWFGQPFPENNVNGLECTEAGQTFIYMAQLPPGQGYSQPSVVDVHAYPCNVNPNAAPNASSDCYTTDATQNAETLYNDLWAFLQYRGLTGATAVLGESSVVSWNTTPGAQPTDPNYPGDQCPWQPSPYWAVNGYEASSLYANHASATIFQPFNVLENACYSNPITLSPPY